MLFTLYQKIANFVAKLQRRFIGMKKVECIVGIVAFVCVACGGSSSQPSVQFDLEKLKSEGYTLVTCDGEGTVDVKCKRCFGLGKLKKKIK